MSEYNLLEEKWIRVHTLSADVVEVSLKEVLTDAHKFQGLAGEMETQNIAVLRFLISILFTVFSRADEYGEYYELSEADDGYDEALQRWKGLWDLKEFPKKPIIDYLTKWKDRFWLFDERHPFWQIPEERITEFLPRNKKLTSHASPKLNGEISESGNKPRLFLTRTEKEILTYAEAARWLLSINCWDDSASTKSNIGEAPGCGWLGKCGTIYAVGDNLFETLMLNLTLLKDGDEVWEKANPFWEKDADSLSTYYGMVCPNDIASLYSLRTRYMILERDNETVKSVSSAKKEVFSEKNAFTEQMTLWKPRNKNDEYFPQKHEKERSIWREFSSIFNPNNSEKDSYRNPGVVQWIETLIGKKCMMSEKHICYQTVDVKYDDKKGSIIDAFNDTLTFHASLLSQLGEVWRIMIAEEIGRCEETAEIIGRLEYNLKKASGMVGKKDAEEKKKKDEKSKSENSYAKAEFYSAIDRPFRQWLYQLNPLDDGQSRDYLREEWHRQARSVAVKQAERMVREAGSAAFIGRTCDGRHISSPEAMNQFYFNLHKIYPKDGK